MRSYRFLLGISRESIGVSFLWRREPRVGHNWSLNVDYADSYGLIAVSGSPGRRGRPRRLRAHRQHRAEVAFLVADAWQGHGIATILLAHLADYAHAAGISYVHRRSDGGQPPDDRGVPRERVRGRGPPTPDAIEIEFPTSLAPQALERFAGARPDRIRGGGQQRARTASVAVIGASRRRGTVGGELLHNMVAAGFARRRVRGQRARRTDQVADRLPVGVRASRAGRSCGRRRSAPSGSIEAAVRDCAALGVRALVVISAGFAEIGGDGRRAPGRADGDMPGVRDPPRRAQLPRRAEHRRRRSR